MCCKIYAIRARQRLGFLRIRWMGLTEVAWFTSAGLESRWKSKNSVGDLSALSRVSWQKCQRPVLDLLRGVRTRKDLTASLMRKMASICVEEKVKGEQRGTREARFQTLNLFNNQIDCAARSHYVELALLLRPPPPSHSSPS